MTDKAKELYDGFWYCLMGSDIQDRDYWSRQCSLVAIDNIIKALEEHKWQNRHIINEYEQLKKELDERI